MALACFSEANILLAYALGMVISAVSRLIAILIKDKINEQKRVVNHNWQAEQPL